MKQMPRSMDTLTAAWRCPDGAPVVPPWTRAPCRPPAWWRAGGKSALAVWKTTKSACRASPRLTPLSSGVSGKTRSDRGCSKLRGEPPQPCSSSPRGIRKKSLVSCENDWQMKSRVYTFCGLHLFLSTIPFFFFFFWSWDILKCQGVSFYSRREINTIKR